MSKRQRNIRANDLDKPNLGMQDPFLKESSAMEVSISGSDLDTDLIRIAGTAI